MGWRQCVRCNYEFGFCVYVRTNSNVILAKIQRPVVERVHVFCLLFFVFGSCERDNVRHPFIASVFVKVVEHLFRNMENKK